jgi:hypothetical protein
MELAPKKSAQPSRVPMGRGRVSLFGKQTSCISLVKLLSGGPGPNARPAAFAGRSKSIFPGWDTPLAYTAEYPIPLREASFNQPLLESDKTRGDLCENFGGK